jgi:hypothetical protein
LSDLKEEGQPVRPVQGNRGEVFIQIFVQNTRCLKYVKSVTMIFLLFRYCVCYGVVLNVLILAYSTDSPRYFGCKTSIITSREGEIISALNPQQLALIIWRPDSRKVSFYCQNLTLIYCV